MWVHAQRHCWNVYSKDINYFLTPLPEKSSRFSREARLVEVELKVYWKSWFNLLVPFFTLNPAGEVCLAHARAITINHSILLPLSVSHSIFLLCTFRVLSYALSLQEIQSHLSEHNNSKLVTNLGADGIQQTFLRQPTPDSLNCLFVTCLWCYLKEKHFMINGLMT